MAGLSDMVVEFNPMRWRAYDDLPDKAEHRLVKVQSRLQGALGNMNFAFNLRRPPFDNRLVRDAITQLFDFEWINRVLLNGWAERNPSRFPNSELTRNSLFPSVMAAVISASNAAKLTSCSRKRVMLFMTDIW